MGDRPVSVPLIEIHVQGGVAYVARKDSGVRVVIRDFDNDPRDGDPQVLEASEIVSQDETQEVE